MTKQAIWDYDHENDSIFLYAADAKYEYSIYPEYMILDVSSENSIAGIEILDASLLFRLPKEDLKNTVKFHADISISKETIKVNICLGVAASGREIEKCTTSLGKMT
ncbi:DUF2283 domain-containing protein [Methanosarcina sp. KYL-1]|uniref:DUF2283 domain-containing protein n=1 Tax=Methanosarcina sp. KYL-1 TaxID=2602068 RepID=UPI00210141C8|nr:DUF2283 domain-containing protein [Methanosarcina sp. KYL-1]MCQ1536277.1 DUF2283 domain-containing protein [Methanosarcina sp. KYL-1]